jgi:hypothetical protein
LSTSALLSQIKPPKSHNVPYKMLREPTASDYRPRFRKIVQQIAAIIDAIRRWRSLPPMSVIGFLAN